MANPRQRRKARSSSHKPTRTTNAKSLRKRPPIKGPRVLQKAWDKTKTLRQNYASLGFLADVNTLEPSSCAVETTSSSTPSPSSSNVENVPQSSRSATTGLIPPKSGRILRDADGRVIGVEIPGDEEPSKQVLDEGEEDDTPWGTPMAGDDRPFAPVSAKSSVARELEEMATANATGGKKRRTASMHQVKWLRELVSVHGENIDAMVRDRRRNVWQKTAGELRRAICCPPTPTPSPTPIMNSAQHPGAQPTNNIPSSSSTASSSSSPHQHQPPIRTHPPPPPPLAMPSDSRNSSRVTYFADQHSTHNAWSSAQQLASVQQSPSSSTSGHFASSLPSSSSSLHHHPQHQQPLVVTSNVQNTFSPPLSSLVDASVAPYEGSLSPIDPPTVLNANTNPTQRGSLSQSSQLQQASSSQSQAAAANSSSTKHRAASRAPRTSGHGKPAISVSSKTGPGSGPATGGHGHRSAQPKSSRKQFSACGACQLRQVKCDLKDKIGEEGENASCTACVERGVNCVSVYPNNQKPRAQRRGKRLQVVEKMYGKTAGERFQGGGAGSPAPAGDGLHYNQTGGVGSGIPGAAGQSAITSSPVVDVFPALSSSAAAGVSGVTIHGQAYPRGTYNNQDIPLGHASTSASNVISCIPPLHPEFLDATFYRSFHTQRPIIDPHEFRDRFIASYHAKLAATAPASSSSGSRPHPKTQYKATDELTLLANVLVTWAASYGIDEFGHEDADAAAQDAVVSNVSNGTIGGGDTRSGRVGDESSEQAVADAAARKKRRRLRVTEMVKEILQGVDQLALLRRPTWDGVRVLMLVMPLTEDSLGTMDRLSMYQSTISQIYTLCTHGSTLISGSDRKKMVVARIFWYAYVHEGITSGLRGGKLIFDNDDLTAFEHAHPTFRGAGDSGLAMTAQPTPDRLSYKFATAPIRLSTACRQINFALTGPRAIARRELDDEQLDAGWERLWACWEEFEELRAVLVQNDPNVFLQRPDMERFISGWQIFLFECHSVIREVLSQKKHEEEPFSPEQEGHISDPDEPGAYARTRQQPKKIDNLLQIADTNCRDLFPRVMKLIKDQLNSPTFFQWDASLVRDGTFYAGKWAASDPAGRQEDVDVCIAALRKMKWAFSLSEDRIQTIRYAFNRRVYGPASISPAGGQFGEGTGPLRDHVPVSMHSELAGIASHDPFGPQQWPVPSNYHNSQSVGQRELDSPSFPPDSNGRHVPGSHHNVIVPSSNGGVQLRTWANDWTNSVAHPGINSIPESKHATMSPHSNEFQPSGMYAHGDVDGFRYGLPSHGTSYAPQWDGLAGQRNFSDSSLQSEHPSFVRIESVPNPSLAHRHDGFHPQQSHHGGGYLHHPQHGRGEGHSADEASPDALYTADAAQNLNRTRYPHQHHLM